MEKCNKFNAVIFSITDNCNLKCKYCFVQQDNTHNTNFDLAKQVITILNDNILSEDKSLNFFGGEPLLLWDEIIQPTILYAESLNSNIHFNITTNGTLLDEDKLKFLKNHNVSILLSMDGSKITQNINRPTKNFRINSFDILEPLLPLILEYLPNTTIRGTIYPETCQYLYENLLYFYSLGFKNCFFYPDEFSDWSEENLNILFEELRKYSIYYLESYQQNKIPYIFNPFDNTLINLYNNINNLNQNCQYCGLGEGTIAINYKGDCFACQEFTSYPLENNLYYLGNINSGIDKQKQIALKNLFETEKNKLQSASDYNCNTCICKNICHTTICHANSFLQFQTFTKKSKIKCFWDRTLYQEAKVISEILFLNKNELFKNNLLNLLKGRE